MPNMYRKRTNAPLQPAPPHLLKLVAAAGDHPTLARLIANGFDNLLDLFPLVHGAGGGRAVFTASGSGHSATIVALLLTTDILR
jgi:hypothetical protein